jgi:hypothetical protein
MLAAVRRGITVLVALALMAVIPACSKTTPTATGPRQVSVAKGVRVILPATSHLKVSATSAPLQAASSITTTIKTSSGTEPNPLQLLAQPKLLRSSGSLPPGAVTLTFTIAPPKGPGTTPFIASYDPTTGTWVPVMSHYNARLHTVSAVVPHFSIWGVLRFITSGIDAVVKGALASLIGTVKIKGPNPTCTGSGVTVEVAPNDGTLRFCGQDADASHVVIKVASLLAFPTDLNMPGGSPMALVPPADIYADVDQALLDSGKGKFSGKVIPGGSEADVTLAVAPGQTTQISTDLDTVAYLTSIVFTAVQILTSIESRVASVAVKATMTEIGEGGCAAQIAALPSAVSLDAAELETLTQIGFSCAEQILDLSTVGVIAGVIGIVASLFEDIVQTAFLALETTVGWSTGGDHTLTVTRAAAPIAPVTTTLPTSSASLPMLDVPLGPYDGIEPTDILFSGDATNNVSDITWSSWTQTGVVGQGTWTYLSCVPDCAGSPEVPYPASIQLSDPVNGTFTVITETTQGPEGFTTTYNGTPPGWPTDASGGQPASS